MLCPSVAAVMFFDVADDLIRQDVLLSTQRGFYIISTDFLNYKVFCKESDLERTIPGSTNRI